MHTSLFDIDFGQAITTILSYTIVVIVTVAGEMWEVVVVLVNVVIFA